MPEASHKTLSKERPLSPHIQIYKWQWTSILSILHRLSSLMLGLLFLTFLGWIISLTIGESAYNVFQDVIRSPLGKMILTICCFSFYYHLLHGIRQLSLDLGIGYNLKIAAISGWATLGLSVIASLLTMQGF